MISMLAQNSTPIRKPASVPTTPMLAPAMKKTRITAPRVAPMVRRMAMSRRLVLHQHDQAGDDVQRRDQDDQRQDQEHDIALDLRSRRRRRELMFCQVHACARRARRRADRRPPWPIGLVGIGDHHLERR